MSPGVHGPLPITVQPPRRHIGQIERGSAPTANARAGGQNTRQFGKRVGQIGAPAKGQASGKQRLDHVGSRRDAQAAFIDPRAYAFFSYEHFVFGRVKHHAGDDLAFVF